MSKPSTIELLYLWIKPISHTQEWGSLHTPMDAKQTFFYAALSRHAVDLLHAKNTASVEGSFLKPFLDPLSELAGINMLLSQSGCRRNLPLLLFCSSLWFTAWWSASSLSPACLTVDLKTALRPDKTASKWTIAWQLDATLLCLRVLRRASLTQSSWGGETGKDFPIGHQVTIIARWTWAGDTVLL